MTRKQQIERQIEAAMSSIDGLKRAEPEPYFYTRLSVRMTSEETSFWGRMSRMITRPAIASLSVAVILSANIFVVLHHFSTASQRTEQQAEMAVADEYNRATTLYNIDNVQP